MEHILTVSLTDKVIQILAFKNGDTDSWMEVKYNDV